MGARLKLLLAMVVMCMVGSGLAASELRRPTSKAALRSSTATTTARAAVEVAPVEAAAAPAAQLAVRGGFTRARPAIAAGDHRHSRVSVAWPIFSAWLYFLACAFAIPALPRIVNDIVGGVKGSKVTGKSATVYALIASTDALFTFLTTNFHSTCSDTFGRKRYLLLSTVGLGAGFTITLLSKAVWSLLAAAVVDGCTSCMYAIAQACVADCVGRGDNLSEALALFQGIGIGMAFTIGMPFGGVLAARRGSHAAIGVSIALCVVNALITAALMPESLPQQYRRKSVNLAMANPVGALRLLHRSPLSAGISISYCLHWVANCGLQINFFNYVAHKLGWNQAQAGGGLALMGVMVAAAPKAVIPYLGLRRALPVCLLIFALSQAVIGAAPAHGGTPFVYTGLALAAVGSVAFPCTLALMNQQVEDDEGGAIQGAADTIKTATTVLSNPLMAACFGYFISEKAPKGLVGGSYYVGSGIGVLAALVALVAVTRHGHLVEDDSFGHKARMAAVAAA